MGAFSTRIDSFGLEAPGGQAYTYGEFTPASTTGVIAGARTMRTIDTATGDTLGFQYETYDATGTLRSYREQWGSIKGSHFIFDANGEFVGWRD